MFIVTFSQTKEKEKIIMKQNEYAIYLKNATKELVDKLDIETAEDLKTLSIIYNFVKAGFLENKAGKVVA